MINDEFQIFKLIKEIRTHDLITKMHSLRKHMLFDLCPILSSSELAKYWEWFSSPNWRAPEGHSFQHQNSTPCTGYICINRYKHVKINWSLRQTMSCTTNSVQVSNGHQRRSCPFSGSTQRQDNAKTELHSAGGDFKVEFTLLWERFDVCSTRPNLAHGEKWCAQFA